MLSGTSTEHTRSYNQRVILEAIRLFEPISKAEIARHTNLTQPTVATIVGELLEREVVRASGKRQGQRGQPALELTLNPTGAYAVGLHLDRDQLTGVLIDLKGEVHARQHHILHAPSPEDTLPLMARTVEALRDSRPIPAEAFWGVGLALPGPLEETSGKLVAPPNFPGWDGVAPGTWLSAHLGTPVFMESDGLAAAIGEQLYGVGQVSSHFFYLYLGVGLGGAMIVNGRPYRGFSGDMGGIGHIPVEPVGRPCPCGGHGCLERYASLSALYDTLREHGIETAHPRDLERLHREQHPALTAWLDEAARHLTLALVTLENLLNPDLIVFGGHLPQRVLNDLLSRLEVLLPTRQMRALRRHPKIARAHRAEDAISLGAASLPLFDAISPNHDVLLKPSPGERRKEGSSETVLHTARV